MKNKRLIIFLLILGVFVIGLLSFIKSSQFRVVSTHPDLSRVPTSSTFIDINFNQSLDSQNVTTLVTGDPSRIVKNTEIDNKSIRIFFNQPLNDKGKYRIDLGPIVSKSGKKIHSYSLVIRAYYVPLEQLSKNDQNAVLQQPSNDEVANDPLLSHLPYGGIHFSLKATSDPSSKSKVSIEAHILLDNSDIGNESAAVTAYKQEVVSYIQSLNLDPANYNITYIVEEPSRF